MASIVIPAHNEERVIGETLATLIDGLDTSVEVVVACNGCRDRTAEVSRRFGARVRVLEIETASKVVALNEADEAARSFPRIYLDADILLEGRDAQRLLETLSRPGALAAEPNVRFDVSKSDFWVRSWYAVWNSLHGHQPGDVGGGLYALTEEGRRRFGSFPDIISDDGFVRAHFEPGEIERCMEATTVVRAPRTVTDLMRIKVRSRLGNRQLAQRFPELWRHKREARRGLLSRVLGLRPLVWPLLPIYATIQLIVRGRARERERDFDEYRWESDRSTR